MAVKKNVSAQSAVGLCRRPDGVGAQPERRGCVLFVKLRQFPGCERRHVVLETGKLPWKPSPIAAIACKKLYQQAGFLFAKGRLHAGLPGANLNHRTQPALLSDPKHSAAAPARGPDAKEFPILHLISPRARWRS
jgi:hypothetical protein